MKRYFILCTISLCLLCCACQMQTRENKELSEEKIASDKKDRIVKIELRSRNPMEHVRYQITQFKYMWKAAGYSTIIENPDTLRIVDSLLTNLSGAQKQHLSNLFAGILLIRESGTKDTVIFGGGGIIHKGKRYTYESNSELINVLSKHLPYVESLLWQLAVFPNDTTLKVQLDKEIKRLLEQKQPAEQDSQ